MKHYVTHLAAALLAVTGGVLGTSLGDGGDLRDRGTRPALVGPPLAPRSGQPAQRGPGQGRVDDPRRVVLAALQAVQGDSAARVGAEWSARLRRDTADSAAQLGLATLARLTYDYPDATRRYEALYAADSVHPSHVAVYARLGQGQALDTRGLVGEAGTQFSRARAGARLVRDPAAEGEALVGLSFVRATTAGIPAGLALLDTAARLIPPDALDLQAIRRCRRAVLLAILTRPEAVTEAVTGAALAREAGDVRTEAHCVRSAALAHKLRGDPDSSLVLLHQATALHHRARDRSALGETLMRAADVLRERGEYGQAKVELEEALRETQASHNLLGLASAHLGLGALALQLNDHATAGDNVRRAVAMFEAQGDTGGVMTARSFLVDVSLAAGEYGEARRLAQELLRWYQHTEEAPDQLEMYQALALIAVRERDWPAAERALEDARALARREREPAWDDALLADYARLALARGNLDDAERRFTTYLRQLDSSQHIHKHAARTRLAEVYARRGELERAERELAGASDDLDAWRATLADRELRILAFQASPWELDDRDASVARVLSALAGGGRAAGAFQLAERRRARELADRLLRAEALRADTLHPDTAHRAGAYALPRARYATASEAAAALPDSTALLEYVTGAGGAPTTLFVLSPPSRGSAVRAYVLPSADSLAGQIRRLVALIESGGDPRGLTKVLGAALLGPALAELAPDVTRLVIVPDGLLHRVPFDVLRLPDSRFAVERFTISIAPSALVVRELWQRDRAADPRPMRLLAFGDPTFAGGGAASTTEVYRSAFDEAGGLPRLAESGREARLVAAYAPGAVVRLREEASEAFLKHAPLSAYRVIHFATHALVDERAAGRTALALAPGGGESGFVPPGDLAALRLAADLVVLSACRTAGGVVVTGEGVQGLTAPLLQAGARSVVATGWRVGDRSTARFVEAFYGELAEGLPVASALRAAKLDAIRRGAPPSEWAAFTVVGDPLVRVPLSRPATERSLLSRPARVAALAAVLLVLAAVAGVATHARRR